MNIEGSDSFHKEQVRLRFEEGAFEYCREREQQYTFVSQKKIVLEMLDKIEGKILDIGCGPGVMEIELLQRGYEVWGIDISEE
ncbi:unnamed protein product, partial [marine sediment metagenome]